MNTTSKPRKELKISGQPVCLLALSVLAGIGVLFLIGFWTPQHKLLSAPFERQVPAAA